MAYGPGGLEASVLPTIDQNVDTAAGQLCVQELEEQSPPTSRRGRSHSAAPDLEAKSRSPASSRGRRAGRPPRNSTPSRPEAEDPSRIAALEAELLQWKQRAEMTTQRSAAVAVTSMARESASAAVHANDQAQMAALATEIRDADRRAKMAQEEAGHRETNLMTQAKQTFDQLSQQNIALSQASHAQAMAVNENEARLEAEARQAIVSLESQANAAHEQVMEAQTAHLQRQALEESTGLRNRITQLENANAQLQVDHDLVKAQLAEAMAYNQTLSQELAELKLY